MVGRVECVGAGRNQLDVSWREPEFANGRMVKYLVRYRAGANEESWSKVEIDVDNDDENGKKNKSSSLSCYETSIFNLKPFTRYIK